MRLRAASASRVGLVGLVGLVALVNLGSCKLFGTRITREDCDVWTRHYKDVAKKVLAKDFVKCGMDDDDIEEGGGFILKSCQNNVGQPYDKKDEQCFHDGKSLDDWQKCSFGAATMFHGFENAIAAQRGFLEDLCAK
jgi:hypothetical protein